MTVHLQHDWYYATGGMYPQLAGWYCRQEGCEAHSDDTPEEVRLRGLARGLGLTEEAVGWARELMEQGYVDEHIVTFTENGYGLQHPIRCRPDLIGCILNEWLASEMAPAREPGRYVMEWRKNGPTYKEVVA